MTLSPFLNPGAVNYFLFTDYADHAGTQDKNTLGQNAGLFGDFPTHQTAILVNTSLINRDYYFIDIFLYQFPHHDDIQHGQWFGAHDDDIVNQMVNHIEADIIDFIKLLG